MTTSATASFDPTADEIVTDALRELGVLNAEHDADAAQLSLGRRFLNYIMKALPNEGVSLRVLERVTLATPGISFSAADDTEDVTKMFWTDVGGSDHPVDKGARDDYDDLSLKTTSAPPTQFFCDQANGGFLVYLYPVPDANVVSVTYTRRRRYRDTDSGDVTLDVPQKWHLAVMFKLCALLAPHYGQSSKKAAFLEDYEREKNLANMADTETGPVRFIVDSGVTYDDI